MTTGSSYTLLSKMDEPAIKPQNSTALPVAEM